MKFVILFVTTCVLYLGHNVDAFGKVACFYNSQAYQRKDLAKVTPEELKPALKHCTHLIYGFIGLDDDKYKAESLDENLDTEKGKNLFRAFTDLKKSNPNLKYLLSVGGFQDEDDSKKWLKALEKNDHRNKFVSTLTEIVNHYGFDGADLAWQFPEAREEKKWYNLFGSSGPVKEREHKEQFTALVREVSAALRGNNHILTLTVMPHINYKAYFDGPNIQDYVEHIHLMTYDYVTPQRNVTQADHAAPTQHVGGRDPEQNIEATVKWWLDQRIPGSKLLIAIPTFGRTWKLVEDSGTGGSPPLRADGPGKKTTYLGEKGTMGFYEICPLLSTTTTSSSTTLLRLVPDRTHHVGPYAFRQDEKLKGLWVSFDDPDSAQNKARYSKTKGLGGVAIMDLSLDDFKGTCNREHIFFPITYAARLGLDS